MPADHYYSPNPQSAHKPAELSFTYRGHSLQFQTDSGVFSRTELDSGTRILLDALPSSLNGHLLDMGCGWGAIGVAVGKAFPELDITMVDINSRACELSRNNAEMNGVRAKVINADGFSAFVNERFDVILENPPIRAGKAVIYQMFADAAACLNPHGCLYLVIRKQQGAPSAEKYLQTLFNNVNIIEKKAGYWIFSCSQVIKE